MGGSFVVEQGAFGPRIVLAGTWDSEIYEYMQRSQINDLCLNYARGWKGRDLDFLRNLGWLKAFAILDWGIRDVSPIHHLPKLQMLEVSTYCKTEIRFECFPCLVDCRLTWREGAASLFQCRTLERLFLSNFTGESTDACGRLAELEALFIASSAVRSLEGLRSLKRIKSLGLYDLKGLESLKGIESLAQLETLEINGCRSLSGIAEIGQLSNLRRLELNDDGGLPSLKPLERLRELHEVFFYESTNILDGDLFPLAHMPHLRKVSFRNRKHYSHRREELVSRTAKGA